MNITIVGAGNIGTQFAVHCAEKKHNVVMFGSKPDKINNQLYILDENQKIIHEGYITKATNDPQVAFEKADVIFITMPAFCMKDIASKIFDYVHRGVKIGLIPGTGGGECAFRECIEKGVVVFGIQRVPSVARLIEYGNSVSAVGYRKELHIAALPNTETKECCNLMESLFDMPCIEMPNYLNLTLTPSNPILHTTRLYTIFKDYQENVRYDSVPLFYEEWNDETSELLFKCDEEVQKICSELEVFDCKR